MHLRILRNDELSFPHPFNCAPDGLLCMGGDLSPQRLLLAYQYGIFPWYSDYEPILWWTPYPRMVLYPKELKVSKSMRSIIKKQTFNISYDSNFEYVINQCKITKRKGQGGTWITNEMKEAYIRLHHMGYAHSVEVWHEGEIVGGLYGISLGKIFYGESMFQHLSNASKFGFIHLTRKLEQEEYALIDCQQETNYMSSFGARTISRELFFRALRVNALKEHNNVSWA